MSIVDPGGGGAAPGAGVPTGSLQSTEVRRVVVVDDHELLRTGTRRILDDTEDFIVVGEAENGEEGLRLASELAPDVVLIDIRLPMMNGIDVARQIVDLHPDIRVLILTAYDDDHYLQAARAAGVAGYLLKTMPSDQLPASIRAACDDPGTFVAPSAGGLKAAPLGADHGTPRLTAREREVVRQVAQGKANKVIGRELGISPRTVEGHLNHVFDKLGTTSRTELVHYAVATGLFVRADAEDGDHQP